LEGLLFGLIGRAGVCADNEEEFDKEIIDLKVEEYIKNRIFGNKWNFLLCRGRYTGCDDEWLYLEKLTFARKYLLQERSLSKNLDMLMEESVPVNFQQYFPIHKIESKSVAELARMLRVHFMDQIDDDCIACTAIYKRPGESTDDKEWKLISKDETISPFNQIRLFMVMDDKIKSGTYPVKFRLDMVDFDNMEGPEYSTLTHVLTDGELLDSEKPFSGRVGCIYYPFYYLAGNRILGVKPMARLRLAQFLDSNYQVKFDDLQNIKYSFHMQVAGKASQGYMGLARGLPGQAGSSDNEIRMSVLPNQHPEVSRMLSKAFLGCKSTQIQYPRLFDAKHSNAGPVYVRVGGKGSFLLRSTHWEQKKGNKYNEYTHIFNDFNWHQPVELVVVAFSSQKLNIAEYDKANINWKNIPCEISLLNPDGLLSNTDGPSLNSNLHYIGKILWESNSNSQIIQPGQFQKANDIDQRDIGNALKEWVKQVLENSTNAADLYRIIHAVMKGQYITERHRPDTFNDFITPGDGYLFAAHFRAQYVSPLGGNPIDSIRPFGPEVINSDSMENKYYTYQIKQFSTDANSGINCSMQLQFCMLLRAPTKQEEYLTPWGGLSGDQSKQKWIVDQANEKDASPKSLF
jgi:hypothetical protein